MVMNELGYCYKSLVVRWTKSAAECYYNGLRCSMCPIAGDLKAQCHMKPVVLELVKKYGKPRKGVEE